MLGDGVEGDRRDIIICHREKGLQRINETHPAYMPLQYPLLFPYGEDGWHTYLENQLGLAHVAEL